MVQVVVIQVLHLQPVHKHQQVQVVAQLLQVHPHIQVHPLATRVTAHIPDTHDTVHTLDIPGIEDKNVKWVIPLSTFFFLLSF